MMSPMEFNSDNDSVSFENGSSEREIALKAQSEYENSNYTEALKHLAAIEDDSKALQHNFIITQFSIDKNIETLINALSTSEDLDLDQQVLTEYNRALALAKYLHRYDEAIAILENRMSILSKSVGLVGDRITFKVCLLLSILYIEVRKCPSKALLLLQYISEKCNASSQPASLPRLKAKCYLLLNDPKSAKRELKAISGDPIVRSYLELQRNNIKKAMKIYGGCVEDSPLYHNNEAVIQFCLGKRNTGVFHAVQATSLESPETLYNLAIMHMFTGNTENAFAILHHLVQRYKHNPRLWFRLAECKLEDMCQISLSDLGIVKRKEELAQSCISGFTKKLVLFCRQPGRKRTFDKESLIFARGCLNNALNMTKTPKTDFYPSSPVVETDSEKFEVAILLSLSYVHLCLEDYVTSLSYAAKALQWKPEGYMKVLANLYAGESLILLNKYDDAMKFFDPKHSVTAPGSGEEVAFPFPESVSWFPLLGRCVLLYGRAVTHSIKGEYDRSEELLKSLESSLESSEEIPVQVIILSIYNQLQLGSVEKAKTIILQTLK
ncbi:CCR4-NOT transcription complex subunit 10 [Halotydeus destructor]|nr:CCR4-NOT transcription complex subunit 10 [Halotydeus destructor]